ncbi:acyl-CoA dehydrogenase family protein [Aeromicrobium alkaliterrae]|uniref:Acyl-CoA dehydrogenase family protein n=1 Tax=Aeromicrobium alkaliterrae TaxID=302168 RepID=A0ABP4W7D7_9ACTN
MDFTYDSETVALRDAVRALLGKAYPSSEDRRRVVEADPGFDESVWTRIAELGVLGLPFSEEDGGSGAGPVEVSVVAEEIGRVLAPEPIIESVVLAGGLVAAAGTAEQRADVLGRLSEGSTVLIPALLDSGQAVSASGEGETVTLTGAKEPVLHGARADELVVSAVTDRGVELFLVKGDAEGLTRTGYRTHDGGRAARVELASTPAVRLGEQGDRSATIEEVLAAARIAYCHEALGAMEVALSQTVEYLKTRKQFGVTLNTFQALTFRAADLYVSMELARSTVMWATLVLADAPERAGEAASRAKAIVSRTSRHIGQEAIQLHGGIGMTAEYSVGHYTSRLTALDHWLGGGADHRAVLADGIRDHDVLEPLA